MDRIATSIAQRLSLRAPQREGLDILSRLAGLVPLHKAGDGDAHDPARTLAAVRAAFPAVDDFERDFPSVCFALATGVGKTRLMGAFITYIRLAHGLRHFFVLAPNLTIYGKLIADFTPGTPKYVFQGVAELRSTRQF